MSSESAWPGWIPPARVARVCLLIGATVHFVFLLSLVTHWLDPLFLEAQTAHGQAGDYFGIHQAGQNLLDGFSIYDGESYRHEAVPEVPYSYFYRYLPPTAYVAAIGAAIFAPWTGYWVWVVLNELLLFALLLSVWRWPHVPTPVRNGLAGLTLGFCPFYLEQWMGQYSLLMAACLWLVFLGEVRPAVSGKGAGKGTGKGTKEVRSPTEGWFQSLLRDPALWGWIGSLAVKSYTLLFAIVFLLQRRWRRVLLGGVIVAATILPYYLIRPEDALEFIRINLRPVPPQLSPGRYGLVAVVQFLAQRFVPADTILDLGVKVVTGDQLLVYLWICLIGGGALLVTLLTFRRARSERLLILWVLAFFCVYKDIWEYHHVMLLPALFVFALGHRSRVPWLLLLWFALPSANVWAVEFWKETPIREWSLLHAAIHHVFYAVPVGVFYLWTIRRCFDRRSLPVAPFAGILIPSYPRGESPLRVPPPAGDNLYRAASQGGVSRVSQHGEQRP